MPRPDSDWILVIDAAREQDMSPQQFRANYVRTGLLIEYTVSPRKSKLLRSDYERVLAPVKKTG